MSGSTTSAPTPEPTPPRLSFSWLEHAPSPMATVEGATHRVSDINAAFRRLVGVGRDELIGRPFREVLPERLECLALLDHVYQTGRAASLEGPDVEGPTPLFSSYLVWPVVTGGGPVGAVIQVTEVAPLREGMLAMNQALLLGALRQHELTEAADLANARLQTEIGQRMQSERDALMLTKEISHRIKNNLQVVVGLIAGEIRRAPPELVQGYAALEARIAAIAELYHLISRSAGVETVSLDAYLGEIARTMSASLLEPSSAVSIEVRAEAIDIDPDRAVPFGLLINELGTNAIKHAFPGGSGQIVLSAERIGDQIVLTVADNGVGKSAQVPASVPGNHGSDYLPIFVRQLGGTMEEPKSDATGTIVTVKFPVLDVPEPV